LDSRNGIQAVRKPTLVPKVLLWGLGQSIIIAEKRRTKRTADSRSLAADTMNTQSYMLVN